MAVQMNFERDKLFDELGLMRLRESYMRSSEKSPQERFAFVAETFGSNLRACSAHLRLREPSLALLLYADSFIWPFKEGTSHFVLPHLYGGQC